MELHKMTRFLWAYLTILLAFGQVLRAQLPPTEPELKEDGLQIRLDRELYEKQRSIVYTSHLEFDKEPNISDRQLFKIALDAYKEMGVMINKNNLREKRPNVMSTLLVGKEIIFASSAKGPKSPIEPGSQVEGDLAACGEGTGKDHKFGGRCGEVMAFHEYYQSRVDAKKLGKGSGAKIVAISRQPNADGKWEPAIMAPCGDDDNWGCNRLVKELDVLTDEKVAKDSEMSAFDYRKLRKEGKLKTKAESSKGPLPGPSEQKPKPGGGNVDEDGDPLPPSNKLRPNQRPKPSTSQGQGDTFDEDGDKLPPSNKLRPKPKPKPKPSPDGGDSGQDKPDDGGGNGPGNNKRPQRPKKPGKSRPSRRFQA